MSNIRVSVNQLSDEITKSLKEYTNDVEEELEQSKEEVTKDGVKVLKGTSPEKTGQYAKGWRAKKVGKAWVIHNATAYQITHLLEKGHAKVGGGRVAAIPHIAPVEEQVIKEYEKRVERVIKG